MESEINKCPYCHSENIVWLISTKAWRCNDCGVHFPSEYLIKEEKK